MIEWEDSAQPIPSWVYLSDIDEMSAVLCASVGWLIHDGNEVKVLAPNMGNLKSKDTVQVSGVIRIPARCIVNVEELSEPNITSSSLVPSTAP